MPDRAYLSFVRSLPCCVCAHPAPNEAHHHTAGEPERHGKSVGGRRGKGQKADDRETMPLCLKHHGQLHQLRGYFDGYDKAELRAWQDERVRETQALHVLHESKKPEANAVSPTPVPSSLDSFEPKVAAAEFCSAYELSPQVEHDLARLLQRAVRAGGGM